MGRLVQLKELQQTQSVSSVFLSVFLRYLIRFSILPLSLSSWYGATTTTTTTHTIEFRKCYS
jgi:hypothetical protein